MRSEQSYASSRFWILGIALCLTFGCTTSGSIPSSMEISTETRSIKVGEPLIVKLTYKFAKPQTMRATEEVLESIGLDLRDVFVRIEGGEGDRLPEYAIFLSAVKLEDAKGLEYSGHFAILYDYWKKRLMFDKAGSYTIAVSGYAQVSNPLNIAVEQASFLENRALSLLSDPNDYAFLAHGSHEHKEKRPERVLHLKKVVNQCEGTLLAKWAAARLGIEHFEKFHKKHPSFEKFKAKLKQGTVEEPLFDQAYTYLSKASALPDEFPIREEAIYRLSVTEVIKGNYAKATSLVDELGAKYPKGKHGKKASKLRKEILKLQRRESEAPK